jgi:hypothetical protein
MEQFADRLRMLRKERRVSPRTIALASASESLISPVIFVSDRRYWLYRPQRLDLRQLGKLGKLRKVRKLGLARIPFLAQMPTHFTSPDQPS